MPIVNSIAVLDVDPKFIFELAMGVRLPADLAAEFGYAPAEWDVLKDLPAFQKAIDIRRAELTAQGVTFRLKASMMVESLLPDLYAAASDDTASFHTKLSAITFLAKAAGLDSPAKTEEKAGTTFSISIDLGGGQVVSVGVKTGKDERIIEAEVEEEYGVEELGKGYSTTTFADYTPVPLPLSPAPSGPVTE